MEEGPPFYTVIRPWHDYGSLARCSFCGEWSVYDEAVPWLRSERAHRECAVRAFTGTIVETQASLHKPRDPAAPGEGFDFSWPARGYGPFGYTQPSLPIQIPKLSWRVRLAYRWARFRHWWFGTWVSFLRPRP